MLKKTSKLLLILMIIISSLDVGAEKLKPGDSEEYKVKGAILFLFAKFVQFPANSFNSNNIVIGVLGEYPFENFLDELSANHSIKNRKFTLKRYHSVSEIENCQILFISESEEGKISQVISKIARMPILTVSDMNNFCQKGGIVRLLIVNNYLKFEVNLDAAQKAGLNIGSQMLNSALSIYKSK